MSRSAQSARTAAISSAVGGANRTSSSASRSTAQALIAVAARPPATSTVCVPGSGPRVQVIDTSPFWSVVARAGSTWPLPGIVTKSTETPGNRAPSRIHGAEHDRFVEAGADKGGLTPAGHDGDGGRRGRGPGLDRIAGPLASRRGLRAPAAPAACASVPAGDSPGTGVSFAYRPCTANRPPQMPDLRIVPRHPLAAETITQTVSCVAWPCACPHGMRRRTFARSVR